MIKRGAVVGDSSMQSAEGTKSQSLNRAILPNPVTYRAWVQQMLHKLNLPKSPTSSQAGLAANTINKFVDGDGGRDCRLGSASKIEKVLVEEANKRNIKLPPFSDFEDNGAES